MSGNTSLIGLRTNPSATGDPDYEVEVTDEDETGVTVRYLNGGLEWWISRHAWFSWVAAEKARGIPSGDGVPE